jgi:hypothetical protein
MRLVMTDSPRLRLVRGVDGRPTRLGSKNRSNGAKNTESSNKAATLASSIDSRRSSFGKNRSQNVD